MTIRRITANLPDDLVREAQQITGAGLTETLIRGLDMVRRSASYAKAQRLRGKLDLDIDLEISRERRRH